MPYSLYVCLQDENKIAAFTMDTDTGRLTPQAEVLAPGGPSVLAISPDRHVLYVGHRVLPAISSFRIDHATGGLTLQGRVSPEHAPTFLATDRTGRYLLSAYYQGGYAAVHPLAEDGAVGAPALNRLRSLSRSYEPRGIDQIIPWKFLFTGNLQPEPFTSLLTRDLTTR